MVVLAVLVASTATGRVGVPVVLTAMFLLGTAETVADTTSTTLLPMLVAKPDLGIANARLSAGLIVGNQLAGPPIGAALFPRRGLAIRGPGGAARVGRAVDLQDRAAQHAPGGDGRPAPGAGRTSPRGCAGSGRTRRCAPWS